MSGSRTPNTPTRYGILVGVDGSQQSYTAARWAAEEARLFGLPVTLMDVVTPTAATWSRVPLEQTIAECERENAEDILASARDTVAACTIRGEIPEVRTEVAHAPALKTLIDASKDARMVVVGDRGLSGVGRLLMGSVSTGLIHHAHCPVTVVHSRHGRLPDADGPVLLGIDGSPAPEAATAVAFEEAERRGVDLVAVHAWCDVGLLPLTGVDWRSREQEAGELLAERLAGWQEQFPGVAVRRRVEFDKPARWLIDESRTAQLIVVGSHGRGGFAGMLLGSVSSAVAQSVEIPVIVVRPT
ncbi:universal stress protein UspA-like protein [Mycolicibacterium chubuense NBB4]|uniref:Universal stress protein UspA-like protein n=1 Tax=Mycolicibacterium chubuense (strain NBB4) TaxID=710421 RepID=I4BEX9_MYCCN|nr:universal stress protein [Mycolicibacterium chubuense]AFM15836.1 universal stress protein UspA-like protein [Mycolicibacterium chubuense NBB4]